VVSVTRPGGGTVVLLCLRQRAIESTSAPTIACLVAHVALHQTLLHTKKSLRVIFRTVRDWKARRPCFSFLWICSHSPVGKMLHLVGVLV